MESDVVVVPWEHWVCTQCLQENPYAIWLIKLKCFNPNRHGHHFPDKRTLVSIEPSTMALVKMRPLPRCAFNIRGRFVLCRKYLDCRHGDSCNFAHSPVEQHTWNFIKTLYKGIYTSICVFCTHTIALPLFANTYYKCTSCMVVLLLFQISN